MEEFVKMAIAAFAGGAGVVAIGSLIGKTWLEKNIEHSISHGYAKKLVDYQEQQEAKKRAALVAELLACWIADTDPDRERLNKLTFEAFLWLPCDVAQKLMNSLAHEPGAPTARELIAEVRQLLNKDGALPASQVVIFEPVTITPPAPGAGTP